MTVSTHDLQVTDTSVVKVFRSWERGEPDREWSSLKLLHRWTPGLAPEPITRREDSGRPVIVMSKISGEPLGDRPISAAQIAAVSDALTHLHRSIPDSAVAGLPARVFAPAVAVDELRERFADRPRVSAEVSRAFTAGAAWLDSAEASLFASDQVHPVFGHADGNLANYLWDGSLCRVVDFENAGASDEAYEIAELVEHPSTWLDEGLDADVLLTHLDVGPTLLARILLARRVLACNWLTKLTPDQPAHGRNALSSIERQAERLLSLL